MNTEKELSEYIGRYLNNELTDSEKEVFEFKQRTNREFAEQVEKHRIVHEIIIDQGLIELKKKIKSGKYASRSGSRSKAYTIGGSILLVALLSGYYYYSNTDKTDPGKEQLSSVPLQSNRDVVAPEPIEKIQAKRQNNHYSAGGNKVLPSSIIASDTVPGIKNEALGLSDTATVTKNTSTDPVSVKELLSPEKPKDIPKRDEPVKKKRMIHIQQGDTLAKPALNINEYQFNPSLGQVWDFPISEGDNCDIKIMSRSGVILYQAYINNGSPGSWNGFTLQGIEAPMEAYLYIISYPDGKINKGYVTVVR